MCRFHITSNYPMQITAIHPEVNITDVFGILLPPSFFNGIITMASVSISIEDPIRYQDRTSPNRIPILTNRYDSVQPIFCYQFRKLFSCQHIRLLHHFVIAAKERWRCCQESCKLGTHNGMNHLKHLHFFVGIVTKAGCHIGRTTYPNKILVVLINCASFDFSDLDAPHLPIVYTYTTREVVSR